MNHSLKNEISPLPASPGYLFEEGGGLMVMKTWQVRHPRKGVISLGLVTQQLTRGVLLRIFSASSRDHLSIEIVSSDEGW